MYGSNLPTQPNLSSLPTIQERQAVHAANEGRGRRYRIDEERLSTAARRCRSWRAAVHRDDYETETLDS